MFQSTGAQYGEWLYRPPVSAFAIDPGTGALRFLNRVSAHGSAPCHCCVDASGSHFFCASYASGTVASFAIQADGSLAPASHVVQHSNGDLQPHAHSVTMSPDNTELIAVDLGLDQVRRYALSAATGAFSLRQTLQMKQGLGACLFTFGKTGEHAYVGNECVDNSLRFQHRWISTKTNLANGFFWCNWADTIPVCAIWHLKTRKTAFAPME